MVSKPLPINQKTKSKFLIYRVIFISATNVKQEKRNISRILSKRTVVNRAFKIRLTSSNVRQVFLIGNNFIYQLIIGLLVCGW